MIDPVIDKSMQNELNEIREISLKDILVKIIEWWKFLLSKWKIIFFVAIIGSAIGLVYSLIKKPIYTAELSFTLQDEKSNGISGALGLASQFGLDLGGGSSGGEFSGDNFLELMKSRLVIEKALLTKVYYGNKTTTLADYYIDINNFRADWADKPKLKNISFENTNRTKFTLSQDSLLGVFHRNIVTGNLSVGKSDKKLSIISLKVFSENEFFSKRFAEVLAKVVSDYYIQSRTEKTAKNVAVLQHQTDSVRLVLYAAIGGLASSNDTNPNANPFLQSLKVSAERKKVDVQINSAILSELYKNLEISKMALLQQTPLIQIIDSPILPLAKERTGKLKGLIVGGLAGGFLIIMFLVIKKIITSLTD